MLPVVPHRVGDPAVAVRVSRGVRGLTMSLPTASSSSERLHRGWVLALVVLCLVVLSLRFFHISGSLPYPYNVDEEAVIGPARHMLVTGNFHPHEFNYPS